MLSWFDTSEAEAFAGELAAFMLRELKDEKLHDLGPKSRKRAERTMEKAARRIEEFRATQRLNFYKKSKLANTFLWALKDAGCAPELANQLTDWLTPRL